MRSCEDLDQIVRRPVVSPQGLLSETVEMNAKLIDGWAKIGIAAGVAALEPFKGLKPVADTQRFWSAEIAEPNIDKMPKVKIAEDDRADLYKYEAAESLYPGCEPQRIPLVTVFALMNSGDMLGKTIVPEMLKRGFPVYRVDWKEPQRGDPNNKFEDYFLKTLPDAIEEVKKDSGVDEVSLLGWCQGGYGSTVLASVQGQMAVREGRPESEGIGIRNLIQLTTPLNISEEDKLSGFAKMATDPEFNQAEIVEANGGIFPGAMIDAASKELKPYENKYGTHFYLTNMILDGREDKVQAWEEMHGWASNLKNMSGDAHAFLLRELYNNNSLAEGTMVVDGMTASLANVKNVGVLGNVADRDHIVKKGQSTKGFDLIGSKDKTLKEYPNAGHISIANEATCQDIADWLTPRSK